MSKQTLTFEAKKDKLFSFFFYGYFLFSMIMMLLIFQKENVESKWWVISLLMVVMLLMMWLWYGTSYEIYNTMLRITSGPIKKNIPIRTIRKIQVGKTMWVGLKLGLSMNGLIIHYDKYDEVYITPENQEKFLKQLKSINKEIEIVY